MNGKRDSAGHDRHSRFSAETERELWWTVFEEANDAILILDESGRILAGNKRAERMYGYTAHEFCDLSLLDIRAHETHVLLADQMREAISHQGATWETIQQRKDGSRFPVEVSTRPFVSSDRRYFVHIVRDITESVKAREAALEYQETLRKTHEMLETVTKGTEVLVAALDTDFRYTFFNEAYADEVRLQTGSTLRIGDSLADSLARLPEQQVAAMARWRKTLQGESLAYRVKFSMPDGSPRIFDVRQMPLRDMNGCITGAGEVAVNMSRQVQLEEDLSESRDRFRIAQEISLQAFTILRAIRDEQGTLKDFEWTYANRAASQILRRPAEELVGKRLLSVLPGNLTNQDLFRRYVRIVDTGQGDEVELEYTHEGLSGWYHNMAVKLGDGVAISFSDITARKQAEESRQRALEERTLLFRELEHRVKNSFTLIESLVRLEVEQTSSADAREALKSLDRRLRTLSSLYAALHLSGEVFTIRLDGYLTQIARTVIATFADSTERIEIRLELETVLTTTKNASPVGLILNELLSNALKYAFPDMRKGRVVVRLRRMGEKVVLEVEDNGVGLPHGFDAARSTGLGLTLVRMLARQLNGEYSVSTDACTRFTVTMNQATLTPEKP